MRRKDREITDKKEILEMIARADVIRVALLDAQGLYIVPLHFGFEEGDNVLHFYFHSASAGRKVDAFLKSPTVAFELDSMIALVKGEEACDWSSKFESIIGEGTVALITDQNKKVNAMHQIMRQNGFEGTPVYKESTFLRTSLFDLSVTKLNAKSHQ